ncbi:MAG: complex I subunit 5 family protein [Spirochaetaceae bacterium JB067]
MNLESIAFIFLMAPLLASGFLLLAKTVHHHERLSFVIYYLSTISGFLISLFFTILVLTKVNQRGPVSFYIGAHHSEVAISYTFSLDGLIIFFVALFISFTSWAYNDRKKTKQIEFSIILMIQLFSIGATLFTRDLFNLFVALEIMGITSYVLIAFSSKVRSSVASLYYLLSSSAAMIFFLLGTYLIYRLTGSLNYHQIRETLKGTAMSPATVFAASSIIVAILMRSALFPLHFWLPNAHAMAMHPVSAILSGILIKIPLIALTPFVQLFDFSQSIGTVIKILGALSAFIAVIFAFCQSDIKKLLAYHSISQMGYITAAWGYAMELSLATEAGRILYTASILHIIFHALFKSTLFLSCGTIIDVTAQRNVYKNRNAARILISADRKHLLTIIAFFLSALSITAIPFFNGYYSKNLITSSFHHQWIYTILFITGVFTTASFLKLSAIFFRPGPVENTQTIRKEKVPVLSYVLLIAALTVTAVYHSPIITGLLSSVFSSQSDIHLEFYESEIWMKSVTTIIIGTILYISIRSRTISHLMHLTETVEVNLQSMLISVILSVTGLGIYLLVRGVILI